MPTEALAEQLKLGLRRLGKAVVVITSWHDGRRWAMTATAVSELSMDPPSLLVCVNRSASLHVPLTAGANFCVNILDASQLDIAMASAGKLKGEERFGTGEWAAADCNTPTLKGAQASFLCSYAKHVEYGTHAVIIGEVREVTTSGAADPLIYLDGQFVRAAPLT